MSTIRLYEISDKNNFVLKMITTVMIKCHVCKKNMVYIHLLKFEGLDRRLWIQGKSCLFSITNSFAFKKKKLSTYVFNLVDYRAFRVKRHVYYLIKIIISDR